MNREQDGTDGSFWYRLYTILCNWHPLVQIIQNVKSSLHSKVESSERGKFTPLMLRLIVKYYHGRSKLSLIIVSYRTIIWLLDIVEIRDHCITKPGDTEGFPFGQDVRVFLSHV